MFSVSSMRHGVRRALLFPVMVAAVSGCGLDKQSAPALTGPSELGLSLTLTAIPDQVVRDGTSRSDVTVTARNAENQPEVGRRLTLSIFPANAGSLTASQVVTDSDGKARFTFIAPPLNTPVPNNIVVIGATPVGDNFDNSNTRTVSIVLTPANATAPNPSFIVSPESPRLDQLVTFDASATTDEGVPCGDTCTYAWDFGGEASASGRVVNYQFRTVRTYVVTLAVTDSAGTRATSRQTVTATASTAPTAAISFSPSEPIRGQTVVFTGARSTAANGATIVEYLWDFGNGKTASGVNASTEFPEARTYPVRLTIRDSNGGTDTALEDVEVAAP